MSSPSESSDNISVRVWSLENFGRIWPRAWKLGTKLFITQPHNSSARACFLPAMYLELRLSLLNQSYGIARFYTVYYGADFGTSDCFNISSSVRWPLLTLTTSLDTLVKLPNSWFPSVVAILSLNFEFYLPKWLYRFWRLDYISRGPLDCPRTWEHLDFADYKHVSATIKVFALPFKTKCMDPWSHNLWRGLSITTVAIRNAWYRYQPFRFYRCGYQYNKAVWPASTK